MANSILNRGGSSGGIINLPRGGNNPMQLMQQFQQFRNTFTGNPQQMVQQMLQSGRVNESQLQQAMQMARQFQSFIK